MTFRHPLRNEWDRLKPQFEAALQSPGTEGEIARAMMKLVPPLLDLIEEQRDRRTASSDKLTAHFAVIGMLLENAIETAYRDPRDRRTALDNLLGRLRTVIAPRLSRNATSAGGGNGLIIPGA